MHIFIIVQNVLLHKIKFCVAEITTSDQIQPFRKSSRLNVWNVSGKDIFGSNTTVLPSRSNLLCVCCQKDPCIEAGSQVEGSEEHWQWRIKHRWAKGAQKAGLFVVQVTKGAVRRWALCCVSVWSRVQVGVKWSYCLRK